MLFLIILSLLIHNGWLCKQHKMSFSMSSTISVIKLTGWSMKAYVSDIYVLRNSVIRPSFSFFSFFLFFLSTFYCTTESTPWVNNAAGLHCATQLSKPVLNTSKIHYYRFSYKNRHFSNLCSVLLFFLNILNSISKAALICIWQE